MVASSSEWLGPVEPRSYRRTGVYFVMNWCFALVFWVAFALCLACLVVSFPLLMAYRSPLRRRRVLHKAVAFLWEQEIAISNLVLPEPLRPILHWDLCRSSIAASLVYFSLWKALCAWALSSLPFVLVLVDTSWLPSYGAEVEFFVESPHPLVARIGLLAYLCLCVVVSDCLVSLIVLVTCKMYEYVFDASIMFHRNLSSTYAMPPPVATLTTYSRLNLPGPTPAKAAKTIAVPSAPTPPTHVVKEMEAVFNDAVLDGKPPLHRLKIDRILATSAAYDHLSPVPTYSPFSPPPSVTPTRQVYRALESNSDVHFAAYGPLCIGMDSFSLDIWAFLAQQREDMHTAALESGRAAALSREALIRQVANGTLVHISLSDIPNGFELISDSKSHTLLWNGAMQQVSFVLKPTQPQNGLCLFKCTIIVGAKVTELRTYILAHPTHAEDSDDVHLLESTMEVLNRDSCTRIAYTDLDQKELIGTGAGGDSYRAFYKGQEVVVKTIRASEFGDSPSSIVQAFEHEAAVLETFGHHPHIVPFVGACCDPSYPLSLVTSYIPLGSLESHYTSLSLLEKEIILADIASATSTIHSAGFVHRDLAARNCLVDLNHRGILADFGLCRRTSSFGGAFVTHGQGPLKYMAPETLQPPYTFTAQSDSYAFGVLMWETLSASTPFASLPPVEAAVRVLEGQRLPTLQLSGAHRALLERCFDADPAARPSMAQIVFQLKDRGVSKRF